MHIHTHTSKCQKKKKKNPEGYTASSGDSGMETGIRPRRGTWGGFGFLFLLSSSIFFEPLIMRIYLYVTCVIFKQNTF